jgi:hypothetical protein
MDKVPDDVLIQIFHEYVGEKSLMATSLIPVSRRWYNVATTTSALWSKVNIHLKSTYTIPKILPSPAPVSSDSSASPDGPRSPIGLETYLARAEANGAELSLDITIKWDASETPVEDHNKYCDWRWIPKVRCGKGPCGYEEECKKQIKRLFMILAGIDQESVDKGSASNPASS